MEDTVALLRGLSSANNAERGAAEAKMQELRSGGFLGELVARFLAVVRERETVPVHLRSLACILLRRILVESEGGWEELPVAAQEGLRSELGDSLMTERDGVVRNHLCDLMGKLAATVIVESDEWPQILPTVQHLLQGSTDPADRECGFRLLEWLVLSTSYLNIFTSTSVLPWLIVTFKTGLSDCALFGRGLLATVKALCALVSQVRLETTVDDLRAGLAGDVNTGLQLMASEDMAAYETNVCEYAKSIISIAAEKPSFYGAEFLGPTLSMTMDLIKGELAPKVRNLLVEFLVTVCESSPHNVKRLKGAGTALLNLMASIMTGLDDSAGFITDEDASSQDGLDGGGGNNSNNDDYDDGDEDEDGDEAEGLVHTAEDAYDRICNALGVNATFPVVSDHLQSYFAAATPSDSIWQKRYAGLLILGNYVSLSARMKNKSNRARHLADATAQLLRLSSDPVPRVRLAAYSATALFLAEAGDQLPDSNLAAFLSAAIAGINIQTNPTARVRRSALSCVINLVDVLPESMLETNSAAILNETTAALSVGPLAVQQKCVSVLVALAQGIKNPLQFGQFYEVILPVLHQLLAYAEANTLATLWGQTIECFSVVGEASGDKFKPEALAMAHSLALASADPPGPAPCRVAQLPEAQSYVLKVWVRLARCLQSDFSPFLPLLVETLLPLLTADITSGTGDLDLDDPALEERSDIDVVENTDGMYLCVRSSAVEEQSSACDLLRHLMASAKDGFFPYVESVTCALLPLLASPHEDVRSLSLATFPELICVVARTQGQRQALEQLLACTLEHVSQAVQKENVIETIMTGLQVLRKCIRDACTDWSHLDAYELSDSSSDEFGQENNQRSVILTTRNSVPILSTSQLQGVSACAKRIIREALQRRAVMQAAARINGKGVEDEEADDEDDNGERASSLEMNYNVCELVGSLLCTHAASFWPVYLEDWHPLVPDLVHPHCLTEDRVVACSLLADVLQHCFVDGDDVSGFFAPVMHSYLDCCANGGSAGLRRMAAFGLGKAAQRFPQSFGAHLHEILAALTVCITRGDEDGQARGCATDNAVWAVGATLHALQMIRVASNPHIAGAAAEIDVSAVWGQWLQYLPCRHDVNEGRTVMRQLCSLLQQRDVTSLFCSADRVSRAVAVLVEVHRDSTLTNVTLSAEICNTLRSLVAQYPQIGALIQGVSL